MQGVGRFLSSEKIDNAFGDDTQVATRSRPVLTEAGRLAFADIAIAFRPGIQLKALHGPLMSAPISRPGAVEFSGGLSSSNVRWSVQKENVTEVALAATAIFSYS